jgi:hypothetical protein
VRRPDTNKSQLTKFGAILALDAVLFDAIVRLQHLEMDCEADQLQTIREHLANPMSAVQSAAYKAMAKALNAKHWPKDHMFREGCRERL